MGRFGSRGGRRQDGSAWRMAGIVVLLAAAAAGAATRRTLRPHGFGSLGTVVTVTVLAGAVVVAGAVVLVLRLVARARRPGGEDGKSARSSRPPGLGRLQRFLVFAGALAIAAVAVLIAFLLARLTFGAPAPSSSAPNPRPRPAHHFAFGSATTWKTWVIAVVVAVAVVIVVLQIARRLRATAPPVQDRSGRDPELEDVVADAAARGRQLLLGAATPRDAVLAAYLTLEHDLAERGIALAVNRTPREILLGPTATTFPEPAAAVTLAGLFERARYSKQPVTEHHRDEALDALDRLIDRTPR